MKKIGFLWCALLFGMGLLMTAGGCGGGGGTWGGGTSPDQVVTLGVYEGGGVKLPEETRALMQEAGIRVVSLDANLRLLGASNQAGQYPEALLLIGSGAGVGVAPVDELTVQRALENVYNRGDDDGAPNGHVLVLHPTEAMMDALSDLVSEDFDIDTTGPTRLLYYGRTQANGVISVVGHIDSSTVPSVYGGDGGEDVTAVPVPSPDIRERVQDYVMLKNWILETRQRENPAGSAQDEEGNNLLEKAQTYVATLSSALWGKAFKINNYVVTVHNFSGSDPTDGKDWFYIHQENIHDGSGAGFTFERECCYWYSRIDGDKYWVGGGDVCDCYLEHLYVENRLENGDDSTVVLSEPKPEAINAETVHTTTTSHSFGTSVSGGFEQGKAKGEVGLSYGYSCSDSKQFTTRDVDVSLETNQKVAWSYSYKRPERSSPWYNLTRPAELAHSTYSPHQMWTWAIDTSARSKHGSYTITFKPTRAGVYTRNSGSLEPRHITQEGEMALKVVLRHPPLLAFEVNELTFDRDGNPTNESKSYANYDVQGKVTMTRNDAWFTASLTSANNKKQVAITGVQKNTTGAARKGTVVLQRDGGGESVTLTINQLP